MDDPEFAIRYQLLLRLAAPGRESYCSLTPKPFKKESFVSIDEYYSQELHGPTPARWINAILGLKLTYSSPLPICLFDIPVDASHELL